MDVAYSAFLKQVGIFLQGKKTCGRIASSVSLDDLCFRLFRHFDAAFFFLKKIFTSWYLVECLVHVHSRSIGGWLSLGM